MQREPLWMIERVHWSGFQYSVYQAYTEANWAVRVQNILAKNFEWGDIDLSLRVFGIMTTQGFDPGNIGL